MRTLEPTGRHSTEGAEIDVTPEMIAAGRAAWASFDPTEWSDYEAGLMVADVFKAMISARDRP